ncbi:hypothetical protein PHYC_03040 [Phycisphaerales bacterium]|nr:hypothetical protein PHYC_03040 [Phycisphaerales bacterium]
MFAVRSFSRRVSRLRSWRLLLMGAASLLVGGCAELPDVKPFAAATLSLEKSVQAGFEASAGAQEQVASLLEVPESHSAKAALEERREEYLALAGSIRTEGEHRAALMRALTDYTDALAAIVDASDNAQGNVNALADSVVGLASVFQASPIPAVAGGAIDLGKLALAEAIKMKASRDLRKGLEAANPVVQRAAELLLADARDLHKTVATKAHAAQAAINLAGGEVYTRQRRHMGRLEGRRVALLKTLNDLASDVDIETHNASDDLLKVEAALSAARAAVEPIERERDQVLGGVRKAERLFATMEEAVAAWGKAHADLTVAAREGGTINVRRLVELAVQAKDIIEKMEKAKEAKNGG